MSMADVTNAEIMGGMFGPNPYTDFPGKVPQPGYVGTPTDAQGNPIQPPPGTTLNSVPAAMQQQASSPSMSVPGNFSDLAGLIPGTQVPLSQLASYMGSQPAATAAPAASAPGQTDLNSALSLLANPGHVTTPGANVPQSPSLANQPSALNAFLANQSGGGTGAGGYSNKGFFDTLNALKTGGSPAASSSLAPDPGASLSAGMAPVTAPGAGVPAPAAPAFNDAPTGHPMTNAPYIGQPAPAPAPAATAAGGLGGLGGLTPQMLQTLAMTRNPNALPSAQQPWQGMGSGNGGAAGNGSSGGQ